MAEQKVTFIISALDNTKAGIASAQKSIQGLGNKFKAFSAVSVASGVALAGLGAIVKSSVAEFREQEQVTTKLTTLILNQKGATMEHVKALKEQAKQMQNVTTFADDLVLTAQAQLATFDLSTDSIQKLIPGFLDMVAAEKGASISMEEMKAAAQGMGKALVGQTDTLTKQGFIFTKLQKDILETGNEEQRLAVITEVMGRTYGGVAANLREDFNGQLIVLQNNLNDAKKAIGEALIPALTKLLEIITPVIERVTAWIEQNPELAKQIILITAGVLAFFAALAPIGFMISGIGLAIAALASPIGLIIIALAALAVAFILNYQKIKANFIDPLISGLHAVNDAITAVLSKIGLLKDGKTFAGQASEGLKFLSENLSGRASGGPVRGGMPYIVGERGPELFIPSQSGSIAPNNTTINMGGITINNEADANDFLQKLSSMLGGKLETSKMGLR